MDRVITAAPQTGAPCSLVRSRPALPCSSKGPSNLHHLRLSSQTGSRSVCTSAGSGSGPSAPDEGKTSPGDWDNAWAAYRRSSRKRRQSGLFATMEQYVSRDFLPSNFPVTEEVDEFRVSERLVLDLWTSQRFRNLGLGVVAGLFVYMVVVVGPPPA